jgi:tryptophan-rich sensory protein
MTFLLFGIFLIACGAAGATGGMFPPGAWYDALKKPAWTPPNWLFPVAWTTLYIFMSAAAARVAMMEGAGLAMALWALQIALNTLWTPVFFGLQRLKAGLIILGMMWISVAACTLALFALDTVSGLLFLPYLLWVSVAGALNYSVVQLNPEAAT